MNPFLLHIGSGGIFWSGLGFLALSILFGFCRLGKARNYLAFIALLFGLIGVGISSTPVFQWLFWLCALLAIGMGFAFCFQYRKAWLFQMGVAVCLLLMGSLELPHWFGRESVEVPGRLWILADSISSGIGFEEEVIWSRLLEAEYPERILNRAIPGSRVVGSRARLDGFEFQTGDALLIELGGNDLLGGDSAVNFRNALDELLAVVSTSGVPTVMLELPLPPFHSAYLRIQRELAEKYGIVLIPRHRFAAVLSGRESTIDGLHLSNYGHRKMADLIREYFVFPSPVKGMSPEF